MVLTVAGATLGKPGRPESANADAYGFRTDPAPGGTSAVLVVCDGVSQVSNRIIAARIARDVILAAPAASAAAWCGDLHSRVLTAHAQIQERHPDGSALSCVAAVMLATDCLHFARSHVGDSAVYAFAHGVLRRLAEGHVRFAPIRVGGRVILDGGAPVVSRGLRQAVGQREAIDPETAEESCEPGMVLCLTTDGVPPAKLELFLQRRGWGFDNDAVRELCRESRQDTGDDATVLIAQLGDDPARERMRTGLSAYGELAGDDRERLLAGLELSAETPLPALLFACATVEDDEERAVRLVRIAARERAAIPRRECVLLLDDAVRRGRRRLTAALTAVLRTLPVR